MAEVWGKTFARRGEAFDGLEGALCEGQPKGEVGVGGQGRGEPVPQPSDLFLGGKVEIVESDTCRGGGGAFLGREPMNELSFRDREGETFGGHNAAEGAVLTLKELDIPPVR